MIVNWREQWENESPSFAKIPPPDHPTFDLFQLIDAALAEDAGDYGDVTTDSTIPADKQATATFISKANGVLAGTWVAHAVFQRVDPSVGLDWLAEDGERVIPGQTLGVATGSARSILVAERIALNFMQRMSGIATLTAEMVDAVSGTKTTVLDTRKTVPGLRVLDKWSVLIGGGQNHRIGLYDMFMIKDNHIAAAGGIAQAVKAAEQFMQEQNIYRPLEVETRNMDELKQVLDILDTKKETTKITRIMLDNMTKKNPDAAGGVEVTMLHEAMKLIGDRVIETEASGNVTLESIRVIADTGVQFVSIGALTHSVAAMDISLLIET